jgi:hypothetical protein
MDQKHTPYAKFKLVQKIDNERSKYIEPEWPKAI